MGVRAYFLTWTTYGTWLPGDSRGWVDRHRTHGEVVEPPDSRREKMAREAMQGASITLNADVRDVVRESIQQTAVYRGWHIHALDVRSNHVHVVISSEDVDSGEVMRILKAYATRDLNERYPGYTKRWWTRQGSKRRLYTEESVTSAVRYVTNQDTAWLKE